MSDELKKKPIYKKWWAWVLGLIVLFILMGSLSPDQPAKVANSDQKAEQQAPKQQESVKTTFKVGEQVKLGDYILIVNDIGPCIPTNQFDKPKAGHKFVYADITQENTGKEPKTYNVYDFKLQDDRDYSYQLGFSMCKQPSFSAGALQPNEKTRGYITFEIPNENNPAKLIFTPSWWSYDQIIINLQ